MLTTPERSPFSEPITRNEASRPYPGQTAARHSVISLACSFAQAEFGVLAWPGTNIAQVADIRTSDKDFENLEGNPLTSGIWSDDDIRWIADSNASNDDGRVA